MVREVYMSLDVKHVTCMDVSYVIVSGFFENDKLNVLFSDRSVAKWNIFENDLIGHYIKLRSLVFLNDNVVNILIENNLGHEFEHISCLLKRYTLDGNPQIIGVRTTAKDKLTEKDMAEIENLNPTTPNQQFVYAVKRILNTRNKL